MYEKRPTATMQPGISAVAIDDQGRVAVATYSTLPFEVEQRDGEIWVDEGSGFANAGAFHGAIRAMAWYGGELWVGGLYTLDGGAGGPGLNVLGASGWHAPPSSRARGNTGAPSRYEKRPTATIAPFGSRARS